MAHDEPADRSGYSIHGWRLSAAIFKKPEQIADVVKRFGPQRPSALREIIQKLDVIVTDYRIARKKRPLKFEDAEPILQQFENSLLKVKEQWLVQLSPMHDAFIALRMRMVPPSERKRESRAAMTSIDLELVATTLLNITGRLRDPKQYAAAHHQPGGKSFERAFLWEPLLRLMKEHHAKPGQHGSFFGAAKALHLAIGIAPPPEGTIKKMLHDLRQGARSKRGKGYATAKERPNA
ncbi:hypothetical protein [Bradyrhizobium sp. RDI18]|uniref:hypothetical protein n=1 Tax=Bradyrhizobium sp. RDI18 TaxID=3367400 RepID=UPI0037134FF7